MPTREGSPGSAAKAAKRVPSADVEDEVLVRDRSAGDLGNGRQGVELEAHATQSRTCEIAASL